MNLYRIHLKTDATSRQNLVDFCLNEKNPQFAIGWSYLHEKQPGIKSAEDLSRAHFQQNGTNKRPLQTFAGLQVDDLIWTRDLNGIYYLGRVKATPYAKCISELDIGALVPVELLKIGTSLPGNITSRFTRSGLSPTVERIKDSSAIAYSQDLYNSKTGKEYYKDYSGYSYDLFEMLPPLDLEELVIDYLQIKYDYYLSKNSVAKLDTTIKVECELFPRKAGALPPAVLQVKGGNKSVSPYDFVDYVSDGKRVFLFFSNQQYGDQLDGITCITKNELVDFIKKNLSILPPAIQRWISLCKL